MKTRVLKCLLLSFGIMGLGLSSVSDQGLDQYRECIGGARESYSKYRDLIPTSLFHLDRNLYRLSERIPFLVENLSLLELRTKAIPNDKHTRYLVANAIESCRTLRGNFERQAHALYLFLYITGATVVLVFLFLTLRPIFSMVPLEEDGDGRGKQRKKASAKAPPKASEDQPARSRRSHKS